MYKWINNSKYTDIASNFNCFDNSFIVGTSKIFFYKTNLKSKKLFLLLLDWSLWARFNLFRNTHGPDIVLSTVPGIAQPPPSFRSMLTNSRMPRPVSGLCTISPASSRCQRVTIGSAAWLGPQRPSTPRPRRPVRPSGLSGRLSFTA